MFERNRIDTGLSEAGVSVEITLSDGAVLVGKLVVSAARNPVEALNGPYPFFELETTQGERLVLAKTAVQSVRFLNPPRASNLANKLKDLEGFEPHQVLGVARGADWALVKSAYHALSMTYHPDRYATAQLPPEVTSYLEAMARRVNLAFQILDRARQVVPIVKPKRAEPVYQTGQAHKPRAAAPSSGTPV